MRMVTESVESQGNGRWSEDRLLVSDRIIGVVDGATPICGRRFCGYSTQAEWLVDCFAKGFERRAAQGETDYPDIAGKVLEELADSEALKELEEADRPSFTSATVTLKDGALLCQVLGDSAIYVRCRDGRISRITDDRVDAFSSRTTEAVERARAAGENPEEAAKRQKLENIRRRNTAEGYWVVGFDGDFRKEFVQCEFPVAEVEQILVCTDGFERIFREFALLTPEEFFKRKISLQEGLRMLRVHEEKNHGSADYPCVKKSDDAAAVLLHMEEENRQGLYPLFCN